MSRTSAAPEAGRADGSHPPQQHGRLAPELQRRPGGRAFWRRLPLRSAATAAAGSSGLQLLLQAPVVGSQSDQLLLQGGGAVAWLRVDCHAVAARGPRRRLPLLLGVGPGGRRGGRAAAAHGAWARLAAKQVIAHD